MMLSTLMLAAALAMNEESPTKPLELSLRDAILATFRNNLDLQTALLDAQASYESYGSTWGEFDTSFFLDATARENVDPPSPQNVSGGIDLGSSGKFEQDSFSLGTGFNGKFTTGTTWDLRLDATVVKTTSDTVVRIPVVDGNGNQIVDGNGNPLFQTRLSSDSNTNNFGSWRLALTQPLLRNFWDGYATTGIELAMQDVHIAEVGTEQVANDTIRAVVTAYWNLVYARQNVDTVELSVDLADELLDITQRKFDQGLQNRIDVIEVEADLANRRQLLLTARNELRQAMDDLRTLVFAPESSEEWDWDIIPTTEYDTAARFDLDMDAAISIALENRPDVIDSRLRLARADIEVRRAETETLPQLDLTGSYGLNSNERNFAASIFDLNDTDFHEAFVTLNFEMPIGNRTAGYNERRTRIDRERAGVAVRDTEITAVAQVREFARNVNLQRERVVATAETTRLRREVYEGEARRLENDLSTPFLVRQAQRDMLEAIDEETRARLDLAVARTDLLTAQGQLFLLSGFEPPAYDVSVDDAPPRP